MKSRSLVIFFVFFILVFILFIYYFSEIKKEFIFLSKVNSWWLLVALLGQGMTYVFSAMVYGSLLKANNMANPRMLWKLVQASIISLFFNQTVPSAGLSGNAYFFNFLARFNMPRTSIIKVIMGELLLFYAAMEALILSLLLICFSMYPHLYGFKSTLVAGLVIYFLFGFAIATAGQRRALGRLYNKIIKSRFFQRIHGKVSNSFGGDEISIAEFNFSSSLSNKKPLIARAFLFQLMLAAADAFTLYALFVGIGYHPDPFIILLTLISTKIISILPFLPGGLILYESSMSLFFVHAGIPAPTAIMVTMVYRLLSFWLPMPIGTVLYKNWLRRSAASGVTP